MLTGLVSITFRDLPARRIVELVAQAGLNGIEWGGDVHVPHGEVETANTVARITRDAGLEVPAYGSYYRVGETDEPPFERVIDSALALNAPLVRIWAGRGEFATMTQDYRRRVAERTREIADLAAAAGLTLAFEYHRNTLTETAASAKRLLELVDRPNVRSLWQPNPRLTVAENEAALRTILPWLTNLHVFTWDHTGTRLPLAAGVMAWMRYLHAVAASGREHAALIEFVAGNNPEHFLSDAHTLRSWLRAQPG